MLLTHYDLLDLVADGAIDAPLDQINSDHVNGASIDVRIGPTLLVEDKPDFSRPDAFIVDVSDKRDLRLPSFREIRMGEAGYTLRPGGCALAATVERFRLPLNIACEFKLKSTIARCFLNNMLATWCDPGWGFESDADTRLTLELHNCMENHYFRLRPGMKIGQMVFFRGKPVPRDRSYIVRGQYNGTDTVAVSRGVV